MRKSGRARLAALTVLAAVAGTASVGIAALVREGVCLHRLGLLGLHAPAEPMAGMSMPGMAMGASPAPCPILLGAAAIAAALYLVALGAIVVLRPRAADLAFASARLVLSCRSAPIAVALAAIGAVPLGAALMMDGAGGAAPYVAAIFLVVCAALCAGVLTASAKLVLSFARRLVIRLLAAARLISDARGPLPARPMLVPVPAGVHLVWRRPSRAPPLR